MNQTMVGKSATGGRYYCTRCSNSFEYTKGPLRCPQCFNRIRDNLVLIDVREVPEEVLMHTAVDFQGG